MTNQQISVLSGDIIRALKPYVKELVAHEATLIPKLVSEHINTQARSVIRDYIHDIVSQVVVVKVEVKGEELAECRAALLDYAAENKKLQALADRQEERIMELVKHYEERVKA